MLSVIIPEVLSRLNLNYPKLELGIYITGGLLAIGLVVWGLTGQKNEDKIDEPNPLEDIKNDLITLNTLERAEAHNKAKELCPVETAKQIYNDYNYMFDLQNMMTNMIRILMNRDIDWLINYCRNVGNILDNNKYGLKRGLEDNAEYREARTDLAKKRVNLKRNKKKKQTIQNNIERTKAFSYGMNSHILLRKAINDTPELVGTAPAELRMVLENIENSTEIVLNTILNDLENEWK